jgi:hypothetical protein
MTGIIRKEAKLNLKSVILGGVVYKIRMAKGLMGEDDEGNRHKLDGEIMFSDTTILLDPAQNEQALILTLLHEVVHAMYVHGGERSRSDHDVDSMAYQLFDVIKNNPKLFQQIIKMKGG